MREFYLYKISNSPNDRLYFGVTCNPKNRWSQHKRLSSNCTKLKRAMDKHGRDNFKFEVICIGSEEYILDLESEVIDAYNSLGNGYNTIPGGNRAGVSLKDDTKQKISIGLRRYYLNHSSSNSGRTIGYRSDDDPVCAFGFWFPNARIAIKALGINRKTFYKRKAEGILHLEARPLKERAKIATSSKSVSKSGSNNPMFGKSGVNHPRAKAIIICGVRYDSISDAVKQTDYTKSQIEKRLKKNLNDFKYAN